MLPTFFASNHASAFFASTPMRAAAWLGTMLVLVWVIGNLMRPRSGATIGEVAALCARRAARIGVFAVLVLVAARTMWFLEHRDGLVGSLAHALSAVIYSVAAYAAGLFIARQFLAPPWWRLHAWDPSEDRQGEHFGIRAAVRWIAEDIHELIASLRILDRIVVLGFIPVTGINAMVMIGVERTLLIVFGVLSVFYLALVVALFSANRIPRVLLTRLQDLRTVARRISHGDLSARVSYLDTAEYEELGELVADVNSMARSLQSREQENHALTHQLNHALQFEQERASRDPLTQLRNHRYFQEALAAELYRCTRTNEMTTIAIIDLDDFKAVNDTFGHQEGDAVLMRTAEAFTQTLRPYDLAARLGGEEFGVIFPSTTPEEAKAVMDRIMDSLATAGPNNTVLTFSGGIATFPLHASEQSMLYQLADSSAYAAKMNGKKHTVVFDPGKISNIAEDDRVSARERDAQLKVAKTLVQTVDMIDGMGGEHSETVGRISAKIAAEMGFDDEFAQQMYLCGLLHDVGKLGLDQRLIQKAGRLTPSEYEQIKRHPDLSAQIALNAGLGEIAGWVRHHHEHFDGTGYPLGLAGQEIPIGSRITLVAEAFDVMTTDRPYRRAMSSKDACQELLAGAGNRFDPDVVGAMVKLVRTGDVWPQGSSVLSNSIWHRAS